MIIETNGKENEDILQNFEFEDIPTPASKGNRLQRTYSITSYQSGGTSNNRWDDGFTLQTDERDMDTVSARSSKQMPNTTRAAGNIISFET